MSSSSGFRPLPLLAILGLIAGGAWYLYTTRADNKPVAPEYTTTTVAKGEIVQVVTATGQLDAVLSVDVGSQISGLIVKLHADFNTVVKKDQVIAEIDPATYRQRLRQAEADLASTKASNRLQQLNTERTRELSAKSLVTQQELDQAEALLSQSNAALLTREAAVENANVDLNRCTIRSPIDGMVISKQTEEGKTVAASLNSPTLFTIANDLAKMQITAAVAEADIGSVQVGQAVTFTADAYPNRNFRGVVTQVRNAPKTTNNVVSYDTIITVDNKDLKLRPGMTANVSIVVAKREDVLRIPNAALRLRMPEGIATVPAVAPVPNLKSEISNPQSAAVPAGNSRELMRKMFGPDAPPEVQAKMREIRAEVGFTPGSGPPTPEQREQMRKLMVERGLIPAEAAAAPENPVVTRTVYRFPGGNKSVPPEAVSVKVGITDNTASEILDGIAVGDVLVTSVTLPAGAKSGAAPAPTNPFGGGARRF